VKVRSLIRRSLLALFRRDDYSRYCVAEMVSRLVYPRYVFSEYGRTYLEDGEVRRRFEHLAGTDNYHSLDRKFTLAQLMKLVAEVEGDTVECGAYNGASSYFICEAIRDSGRRHHVFDSFEGLSAPGPRDGSHWRAGDLGLSEQAIRSNLSAFEFVDYYPGWIPDRFGEVANRRFCFVHVDVDLYEPTRDSLEFFYPRMSPGAILLGDDYGFSTCPGARAAFDEYFATRPESVVMLTTGQAFVIKQ